MKRSNFQQLGDCTMTARDIMHKQAWDLVKLLPNMDEPMREQYRIMADIGKLGEALLALETLNEAETAIHRKEKREAKK